MLPCPAVSIIIPVHNPGQSELSAAIRSALRQTYGNFELLVVDDGSSREVANQIDAAAREDARIRVVHKENGGVSSARNCGLDLSTGELVAFLDADDELERGFVEHAVQVILAEGCDAVFGRIIVKYRDRSSLWRSQPLAVEGNVKRLPIARMDAVRGRILSAKVSEKKDASECELTNVVGALFRSELVRGVRFVVGVSQSEDRLFNVDALGRAKSIALVNSTWYSYDRSNENGSTSQFTGARVRELKRTIEEFAVLGGFGAENVNHQRSLPPEIRSHAAIGVMNHLKLASLAAGNKPSTNSVQAMSALLRSGALRGLSGALPSLHGWDYLVVLLARHQRAGLLVALGSLHEFGTEVKSLGRDWLAEAVDLVRSPLWFGRRRDGSL